jgi:malonyl-CoA O-methyltransferase
MPVSPDSPDGSAVPGLSATAVQRWRRLPRQQSPWLHEEVASRMVERLQWFREPPASWLHWEPVDGGVLAHRRLRERLPKALCHIEARQMVLAQAATQEAAVRSWNPVQWRRALRAPAATADTRVDMVWANMALHQEPQPMQVLQHWHGRLQTGGFLMFSCLGPDTLRELRAVYAGAGWPAPAQAFTDMHDWGDMLVHSGFSAPVMDMEHITLAYSGAVPLLQELRGLGRNFSEQRFPGLRSRQWHSRLCQAIETGLPRDAEGRLLLSFEVIYGHAVKQPPRVPLGPNQSVSLEDMRALLRAGRDA